MSRHDEAGWSAQHVIRVRGPRAAAGRTASRVLSRTFLAACLLAGILPALAQIGCRTDTSEDPGAGANDAGAGANDAGTGRRLGGHAETLWGEPIDLGSVGGLTLIAPFSPANCGYCLFDGEFVLENYLRPNLDRGGHSLHQCLFNPQRDVLAFLKHYREEGMPVLTYPPALHRHHRNGFPFLIAFRDGTPLHAGSIHPYEETRARLSESFWSEEPPVRLTSPTQMATRFLYENESRRSVFVFADGDSDALQEMAQRIDGWRNRPGVVSFEGDLTSEQLRLNLAYSGPLERFHFRGLAWGETPVRIDRDSVWIGPHPFPVGTIALQACFPNPNNPERYVVLSLSGRDGRRPPHRNWVDFAVYAAPARKVASEDATPGGTEEAAGSSDAAWGAPLLQGLFGHLPNGRWVYADSLTFPGAGDARDCAVGGCPAPVAARSSASGGGASPPSSPKDAFRPPSAPMGDSRPPSALIREPSPPGAEIVPSPHGTLHTLSGRGGRLPALACDRQGRCWVGWEEAGAVRLVAIEAGRVAAAHTIAEPGGDCFDVQLAADEGGLWIGYLSNPNGFYRFHVRRLTGGRLEPPVVLSALEPCDATTIALASDGRQQVVAAWSRWQANQRILRYRVIERSVLGPARDVRIAPSSIDYANAWYPSLAFDGRREPWGAWNQHYPATLGVCAGFLDQQASSVTRLGADERSHELGGYPCALTDDTGTRWVVWESFGWDVLGGRAQRILASRFDDATGRWTLAETISDPGQTDLNQTPCAAVDAEGDLCVVWSGRKTSSEDPWGIYAARRRGGAWTTPARISPRGTCARAACIAADATGALWVCWHAGTGDAMRIAVLRMDAAVCAPSGPLRSTGAPGRSRTRGSRPGWRMPE